MPTTAVELPYPNADIVKLPSIIMPKKVFFSRSPRVAPYHGEKTFWPLLPSWASILRSEAQLSMTHHSATRLYSNVTTRIHIIMRIHVYDYTYPYV